MEKPFFLLHAFGTVPKSKGIVMQKATMLTMHAARLKVSIAYLLGQPCKCIKAESYQGSIG